MLPKIKDKIIERPGTYKVKRKQFIPDQNYDEFWAEFYQKIRALPDLIFPIKRGNKTIDPYFGYFGYRYHPVSHRPRYFHAGVDIQGKIGTKIYPVLPGVFEYSGYGTTNGNYILIAHPDVVTEDGFVLHSLYMHLDSALIKFTPYQKMLREISRHTYPKIQIPTTQIIGTLGNTGDLRGIVPHLHLQLEFIDPQGKIVVIDGAKVLGKKTGENLTKHIARQSEFRKFIKEHRASLLPWRTYWSEDLF